MSHVVTVNGLNSEKDRANTSKDRDSRTSGFGRIQTFGDRISRRDTEGPVRSSTPDGQHRRPTHPPRRHQGPSRNMSETTRRETVGVFLYPRNMREKKHTFEKNSQRNSVFCISLRLFVGNMKYFHIPREKKEGEKNSFKACLKSPSQSSNKR